MEAENVSKSEDIPKSFISPLVRLYGCTRNGQSILVHVDGYYPYFYFPVSPTFDESDLKTFIDEIKKQFEEVSIINVEKVIREPLMYYRPGAKEKYENFLKITLENPKQISMVAKNLYDKLSHIFGTDKLYDNQPYESNINYLLRFMVDANLAGGCWIVIPKDKYKLLKENVDSRCQINISCKIEDLVAQSTKDTSLRWSSMAPLRIFCLSVEKLLPEQVLTSSQSTEIEESVCTTTFHLSCKFDFFFFFFFFCFVFFFFPRKICSEKKMFFLFWLF